MTSEWPVEFTDYVAAQDPDLKPECAGKLIVHHASDTGEWVVNGHVRYTFTLPEMSALLDAWDRALPPKR